MYTLDFKGNENNEYERKYYVHNHDVTASCTDNCGLTEITNVTESMETKHVPIFIANLSQKHSGLVENFIKNKPSRLKVMSGKMCQKVNGTTKSSYKLH